MTYPPGPPQPDEPQDGTSPEPTAPLPGWQPGPGQPGYGQRGYGAPPPAPPGYGAPPGPPQGWYAGPPPYRLPDHPEATKALVVGIIALVGGFTCYLPLLLGPWAWVVGRRVVREVDAEPGRWDGRGPAMGGYVMGVVATVLLVLGIVVVVGFILFATGLMVWGTSQPLQGQSL